MQPTAYVVVLAGGSGTRFWPASTADRPKQFLRLAGDASLLVQTIERARELVGPDRILVVSGQALETSTREALADFPGTRLLFEPRPRGTCPALAWAAHALQREDPDAIMVSMHADQRISPVSALRETLARAIAVAQEEYLCCVGVRPDRAETGYGYLELGGSLQPGGREVRRFVEKPDAQTADRYLRSGDYWWNTGIFVWRVSTFLEAVDSHTPEVARALPALDGNDPNGFFERTAAISVDVGVMERATRVATVPAEFDWDDVGVWNALARTLGSDDRGNTVVGQARFNGARDNVVWTESRRATLLGVSNLVVVEANGELLVTTRELAPRLSELRRQLDEPTG